VANDIRDAFLGAGFSLASYQEEPQVEVSASLDPKLRRALECGPITRATVGVARHAALRFHERFEPSGSLLAARKVLFGRFPEGVYHPSRPGWLPHMGDNGYLGRRLENVGFLVIDDEMALPLRESKSLESTRDPHPPPLTAVTCLYRTEW
jgi:hypothetical protein